MTNPVSKNPLVHKIFNGSAGPELVEMLILKQLPFKEEEYLESLVFVLTDESVKAKAMALIKGIPESVKTTYLERTNANHRVAYYLVLEALNTHNTNIIAKAIHNQSFPFEFLLKIAQQGNAAILEILLENQIKLIAYPQILDTIEANPACNQFIKGKIKEIREFYLSPNAAEEIALEDVLEDVKEIFVEEAKKDKAKTDSDQTEASEGDDESEELDELTLEDVEEKAKTTLQLINEMSVSERIKMALVGSKTERGILVKDSNKMVQNAVIESPKLSPEEVGLIIRDKSIPGEIITKLAKNKNWTKDYTIRLDFLHNPKTPVKISMSFIKQLHQRDLQILLKDKNVNPVVRNMAINYNRQKSAK